MDGPGCRPWCAKSALTAAIVRLLCPPLCSLARFWTNPLLVALSTPSLSLFLQLVAPHHHQPTIEQAHVQCFHAAAAARRCDHHQSCLKTADKSRRADSPADRQTFATILKCQDALIGGEKGERDRRARVWIRIPSLLTRSHFSSSAMTAVFQMLIEVGNGDSAICCGQIINAADVYCISIHLSCIPGHVIHAKLDDTHWLWPLLMAAWHSHSARRYPCLVCPEEFIWQGCLKRRA